MQHGFGGARKLGSLTGVGLIDRVRSARGAPQNRYLARHASAFAIIFVFLLMQASPAKEDTQGQAQETQAHMQAQETQAHEEEHTTLSPMQEEQEEEQATEEHLQVRPPPHPQQCFSLTPTRRAALSLRRGRRCLPRPAPPPAPRPLAAPRIFPARTHPAARVNVYACSRRAAQASGASSGAGV
jgi:hypothetical protein